MKITYTVKRGKNIGHVLTPHKHEDGSYVASKTRFEEDYIRVPSVEELAKYLDRGFSIRMSMVGIAPSLITPTSVRIER